MRAHFVQVAECHYFLPEVIYRHLMRASYTRVE
nr:MAG TPA: hypothetical protein [Caudoviricetes sp.]